MGWLSDNYVKDDEARITLNEIKTTYIKAGGKDSVTSLQFGKMLTALAGSRVSVRRNGRIIKAYKLRLK